MNPVLVKLRSEVPESPNPLEILEDILQKTNNIHAAYLFDKIGIQLLQKLSRCLVSTKNSLNYSGWKELGIQLGLDPLLPKCIENSNIMNQDPVYTLFVPYIQLKNATVGKIYQGLFDIKRNDVIFQTQSVVNKFYLKISEKCDVGENLLKPKYIPLPPLIFQNLEENEVKIETIKNKPIKKGKVVMLTHRTEDIEIVQNITKKFREQKIGVILLEEHSDNIFAEQEELILKFISRADYIIPIVSSDYLKSISSKEINSAVDNLDSAYVKYIYCIMTNEFFINGFKNKKIRCVIPDEEFSKVRKHYAFKNPVFRTWVLSSQIDGFANKILSNKI